MLPIEADTTLTFEVLKKAESVFQYLLIPRWFHRCIMVLAIGLVPAWIVTFLVSLAETRGRTPFICGLACVTLFSVLAVLSSRRKRKLQDKRHAAIIGKSMSARFFADHVDLAFAGQQFQVPYLRITRIGRDNDGILIVVNRVLPFWIPTSAFLSVEQRDRAFDVVGKSLQTR